MNKHIQEKEDLKIGDISNLSENHKWYFVGYSQGFKEGAKTSIKQGLFLSLEKELECIKMVEARTKGTPNKELLKK